MFFKNLCVLLLWTKVASALERLKEIISVNLLQLSQAVLNKVIQLLSIVPLSQTTISVDIP